MFVLAIFSVLTLNAQNFQITFSGTGASTTVNTVKVENLNTGTSLTLNGSDILRLTIATAVNSPKDNQSSELRIYPNPMTDYTTLEISPPLAGNAVIVVSEITGKSVYKIQSYLGNLKHYYLLTGLKNGIYVVNIKSNGYQLSGKLVSNGNSNGAIRIEKINSITQSVDIKKLETESKGSLATVDMFYTAGNRLKFTGISGNYSTVITDIPVSDKTINFNFVACTDGDNNNYPVLEIGAQVWMAENLKTTKYKDGSTVIPLKIDNTEWSNLITPGYCWYNNNEATYKTTYGALYNWYTVSTGNLCPTGWHVPKDPEWTTLTDYLGGISIAGGKLKETGITHWNDPNADATNETGYTALPGGYRGSSGTFSYIASGAIFWSATENDVTTSWGRDMGYGNSYVNRNFFNKNLGLSVRCLKDL